MNVNFHMLYLLIRAMLGSKVLGGAPIAAAYTYVINMKNKQTIFGEYKTTAICLQYIITSIVMS